MRAHFKHIDEVITTIKAATIKNKDRKKDFHNAGLPSPSDPVITRWATWLRAALYYNENLPAVRTIVNNWTSSGLLVSRAKDVFFFSSIFILLSRESDQCAIRARLGVASQLSTTPRRGNPAKCLSQRRNK